jgi:sugar phosphate isomerase/epimerase
MTSSGARWHIARNGERISVAMSTASTYPESTVRAFEIASRLGFDGIEIMVTTDPVSQDPQALRRLADHYELPITSIHAPCLLITQRVWTTDPLAKLVRAREVAEAVGAQTVVTHPPFRWQREYANGFEAGIARMADETAVIFAVENMFPWRARGREIAAYLPDWNVANGDYRHTTLDLSHTATAQIDALALADKLGDRLAHVHLADGSGSARDEHLVRPRQPAVRLLRASSSPTLLGDRRHRDQYAPRPTQVRELDLLEALSFARLHLPNAGEPGTPKDRNSPCCDPELPGIGMPVTELAVSRSRNDVRSSLTPRHARSGIAPVR